MKKIKSNLFISVPALKSAWSLSILIAVGFLFYACSETNSPVADSSLPGETLTLASTAIGVNEDPVVIQDFTIEFKGNIYNSEDNTSTFSYEITRNSEASGFNYMVFEIPECAAEDYAGHTPLSSSTKTDNEIRWTSSTGSSRIHTVTYNGKKSTGMIDATIQGTGSGDIETKPIPGPCKGIYTISGFIYVDENGNEIKDAGEGGIGNVTVDIAKNDNTLANKKTSANGSFSFDVFTGDTSTDFTLEINEPSNSFLFDNFSPTTNPPKLSVTISDEDISGKNLGFQAQTGKIIQDFENEATRLQTEKPKFWASELKFADKGRRTIFTKTELLSFLQKIDDEYLDLYDFEFGSDKINKAENILTVRGNSTEQEQLRAELLAAMLNVASGNGAVDEGGNPLVEFNDLIIKTGIAGLISLESGTNSSLMMKNTTEVISTDTITSFSTSGDLITSFNGSGGGVGSK